MIKYEQPIKCEVCDELLGYSMFYRSHYQCIDCAFKGVDCLHEEIGLFDVYSGPSEKPKKIGMAKQCMECKKIMEFKE